MSEYRLFKKIFEYLKSEYKNKYFPDSEAETNIPMLVPEVFVDKKKSKKSSKQKKNNNKKQYFENVKKIEENGSFFSINFIMVNRLSSVLS